MPHSAPENLIISFRSTNNILQSYDRARNAIDINEVKRFSPDIFIKYSASMLDGYINTFFSDLDLCTDYKYIFNKNSAVDSPLEAILFLKVKSGNVLESLIDELRCVVNYGLSLTQENADLFGTADNVNQLSKDKAGFVEEFSRRFLDKHGGKNIPKPFEWKIGGNNSSFIPFQGRIKLGFINNQVDETDFIFLAKIDGFKSSEMLVYLQEIDSELKLHSASITYKAAKPSLLKTTAEIYVNASPAYVTVMAFKKADEKGKVMLYIRDIASYEYDELTELAAST